MGMVIGGHIHKLPTEVQALNTTITSAQATLGTTGTTPTLYYTYGYGFDAGADPFTYGGTFGSIATGVYTDAGSTSRTISSCYSVYIQITDTWKLYFTLNGTSIPDTNTTFSKIIIDSVTFNRTDAELNGNANGGTYWRWSDTVDRFVGANPDTFEVWVI
jgi:hypothetical protein